MSVLIKNMEIPERCAQCFLRVGNCKQRMYMEHRPKDCPLVEAKEPHGRLIDSKELYKYFEVYDDMGGATMIVNHDLIHRDSILYAIEDAPTIIEAEGRET